MQEGKSLEGVEEGGNPFLAVNRFEVEENAVFIDFDASQLIKNLQDFSTLNIYHRLSLAKNIAAIKDITNAHDEYFRFLLALVKQLRHRPAIPRNCSSNSSTTSPSSSSSSTPSPTTSASSSLPSPSSSLALSSRYSPSEADQGGQLRAALQG